MKLFSISLLVIALQVSARAYSKHDTYAAKSGSHKEVFNEFKKQTDGIFFYNTNSITSAATPEARQSVSRSGSNASAPLSIIKGVVKDSAGTLLPGASVAVKGSDGKLKNGVATNSSGMFAINAAVGDVLVVSFIGYNTKEVKIVSETQLEIVLTSAGRTIDQVVVTALGIRKTVKALTYNIQEVKGEEITRVPDASFVNALAGKVAGITINSSASGIGGSTRVVMRGDKSLSATGNNNALYVLDGIPLPNLFSSSSTMSNGVYGGKDGGDGISDFNPEDIASMSVLTGAAAAALYGGMAANGALLINTKKGSAQKTSISFSNATNFYKPFVLPAFQNTYGTSSAGSFDSWGQKLARPSQYDPADFFQTGINVTNSLSLSTGTERSQTYFSAGTSNANGIISNNTFDRYNLTLRHTTNFLDDKLTLDITAMYVRSKNQNMLSQGQYLNPLVPIYLFPRGDDIEKYKVFERYNADRNFKTQFWPTSYGTQNMAMQNPYWTINRDFNMIDKERYILGANLTYRPVNWLTLMTRIRADNTVNRNEVNNYASTLPLLAANSGNGSYLDMTANTRNTYADVLATVEKSFGAIGLTVNAGASLLDNRFRLSGNSMGGDGAPLSKVPNLFTSANIIPQPQPGSQPDITQTQSVYATAQADYKRLVYLNLSARNEWPSQLADNGAARRSLFYPSAGLSFIVSDLVPLPEKIISFLKLRGSYSEVGNPPALFMANPPYDVTVSGPNLNRNLPFNLVPERTRSYEAGITANLLGKKLNLDVTLYKANTFNQVFTFPAPGGSGFANYFLNAGNVENKGIEASLGYNGKAGAVQFNSGVTFTLNRNKIIELAGNAVNPFNGEKLGASDTMYMAGIGSASSAAVLGSSIGDIYVNSLMTDPHGYILINNTTGGMVQANNSQLIYAGNPNPRYKIAFRNGISYRNFNLSFLIDWRIGGRVVSSTQAVMDGYGVSKASADARDNGGVLINGYPVDAQKYYQTVGMGTGVLSQYVYSATNARLREASLSYVVPPAIFKNRLKDVTVSVIGRNLFMFYNKAPFDPENTASTGTYFQGIDYFMTPSLRSFGFSLKVGL
ncbi:SusC/RagA family TonB-linked outer membrane protein [Chitinophaga oryzae]|uniref:SusC/RagA family TonB-linked outer membrane protein n=1 Tax=Chitinophaga oryzae TaxID=2725414 RepID=A0AAE6ZGI9_9BACT|nr:SusC/RagA family TonB-linked outer membrane protein [Chitinophaga oryzae]QJB32560.1 SusC/RagA family TonB-linked outer membrane protein [Chitinophaga oryzae]